ncbi:MAG: N-6 DNA methylase [Candidatus Helarchaeota archaeon]
MNERILEKKRRTYGEHLTPIKIFKQFILGEIKDILYDYKWVDLYAGEGNLILPILDIIPKESRNKFFKNHIFLFDVQKELVEKAIINATNYGISINIAQKNIIVKDTLSSFPKFILNSTIPVYHITNPPYLYIGYIMKHKETNKYLKLFEGKNEGYQDLYQIAMINDLRNNVKKMIYIIPSNFLFGASGTNKIRDNFLKYYKINKAYILEQEIFKHTGVNVVILFFEKKLNPKDEILSFQGIKINNSNKEKTYQLDPRFHYRAGNLFEEFVIKNKAKNPLKISYYLTNEEVKKNPGDYSIEVIDSNSYNGNQYAKKVINVNKTLYNKIKSNILFVRTVDTGSVNGRAGLYLVREWFGVDGILVTKAKYRTHPIQIFLTPQISLHDQILLKKYFNLLLEYFRKNTDSEFMTTYKYSDSIYTRKYLGLSQARKLIETFPINLSQSKKKLMSDLIKNNKNENLKSFIEHLFNTNDLTAYF